MSLNGLIRLIIGLSLFLLNNTKKILPANVRQDFSYILNIVLTIPLRHFGTFSTTIFITITPFYHLNRQKYPKASKKIISRTATIAIGRNAPAITPRQNASTANPAAFEHPLMQKLSIFPTSVIF